MVGTTTEKQCSVYVRTSNGSMAPATTTSPDASSARDVSWAGCGVTNVRKFLYLLPHPRNGDFGGRHMDD